jgi:hypothetical protein
MNRTPLHEIETSVRHAIATVAASPARRRDMHDELLAHLHASYEEELEQLGNPRAAVAAATRRLGDPATLRRQLQASVPLIERLFFRSLSKETLMARWNWYLALFAFFSGPAMMLPALALHKDHGVAWSSIAVPLACGLLVTLGGLAVIALGIIDRLHRRPG